MEKSVLWQAFTALNNLERKHLGQWLESPFFCRRKQPFLLYAYLQDCLQTGRQPDMEPAMRAVQAADLTEMRLLMSELLAQLEHFLVYREKFGPKNDDNIHLAAAYRKRGLDKHFDRALRQARKDQDQLPFKNPEYFEAVAAIEFEAYQFLSSTQRTEALNLQALLDASDQAFIARKLRQACFALTHQAVYRTEYRFGLLDAVLQFLRQTPELLDLPAVALYYHCYRLLTEPEAENHFIRFKAMLFEQLPALPVDEQRDLHLLAINYCVKKINQLQTAYFREALDLYQSALQANLLLENGVLSPFAYNNIVAIALKVGESAFAEQFVHQYAPLLEKKHRHANYQLNRARIAYVQKDYRKALLHLQEADYRDLINNLIAKTLQLKIYFETEEYDALDAHLQSLQAFLRRQKGIGYHQDNFRNILNLTRKLTQINPNDRQERLNLKASIERAAPLTEKEWLLEMVNRLEHT